MPKDPRSLVGNLILRTHVILWRKTKVIFGNSSSSCTESYVFNSFSRNFRFIFTGKSGPNPYRSVYSKRYKGKTSDRAQIFTKCSYVRILLMVVAKTHETFPRLFYTISKNLKVWVKNPRFLITNSILGIHITLWRKTKVIFGISAFSYLEWYVAQHIFQKQFFFGKKAWVT